MAPAKNMTMKVGHGFAAIRTVVDDQPVAAFFQTSFVGDFRRFEQEVAQQFVIFRTGLGNAGNHLLGEKQNMHRGLRVDVADGQHKIVFKNDLRRNFPRDDFSKKGFAHGKL